MIRLLPLCLLLTGCLPADDPPAADDYQPALAVAIGITHGTRPPTPDSDICQNCNGKGKVGDGVIFVDCVVCNGTGRITDGEGLPPGPAPVQPSPSVFVTPDDLDAEAAKLKREIEEWLRKELEKLTADDPAPKPKLTLRTGSGDWCDSCVALQKSIDADEQGIATLLKHFDLTITEYDAAAGIKVPVFVAGGTMIGGPNVAKIVPWLESQLSEEIEE